MSDAAPAEQPTATPPPPARDGTRRALVWALAIGLAVMLIRSAAVVEVTNETWDEDYHVLHGLLDLTNFRHSAPVPIGYNDPPLGGMLVALPVWLAGGTVMGVPEPDHPTKYEWPNRPSSLWGQQWAPNTLRHLIAGWKCFLMLPGLAAAFLWARRLYGAAAGWLAWLLLLFEPTVAAMTPVASLDSPGLSLSLAAAYLIWRYIEAPTQRRLVWACFLTAAALLTKHTAAMLPVYAVLSALIVWPWRDVGRAVHASEDAGGVRSTPYVTRSLRAIGVYLLRIGAAAALTLVFIWPLTKFDVSPPLKAQNPGRQVSAAGTPWWEMDAPDWKKQKMPAGVYIGSLLEARRHNTGGHPAYLQGEVSKTGWWYYFPVVAMYKVPVGHLAVLALGLISFAWRRPRLAEVPLWVAAGCWWALLLSTNINIGWRHALVPYALLLIAATRCVASERAEGGGQKAESGSEQDAGSVSAVRPLPSALSLLAFLAAAVSAVHVTLWHPNYIPYINWPRQKPYLAISDSNLDWGQSARQVGAWLREHRDELPPPIYYSGFGPHKPVQRYVKEVILLGNELPAEGTLIISPVNVAGQYRNTDRFAPLRAAEPEATIGENMLVFDLSKVARQPPPTRPSR